MEVREFAERVLLAETLEEKLAAPGEALTDGTPGGGDVPPVPGRPEALRFLDDRERAVLPGMGRLTDEEDRGRLLHFFANHELLAAELMALALLRFPEAPAAFRRGLVKTLQEEQMHTRLYMKRLRDCGVPFGSQPVNGFFWKAVSSMESEVDYVARLSLTFEQANLDYARHYAGLFRAAGDEATGRLLDRIYRDEIGHVHYGLDWFRRWKDPGESDWEGYRRCLPFPLSPSRAKGAGPFNREGRLLAGLDPGYLDQLEVYTQSKGRTPNVYYFNPQAEWSIAREVAGVTGEGCLPGPLGELAEDLGALALYLARQDDVVVMARRPGLDFLLGLRRAGLPLPEILSPAEAGEALRGRKLGELRPWAWSPDSEALMGPLRSRTTLGYGGWRPGWHLLHSKLFSAELALEAGVGTGVICRDEEEVERVVKGGQGRWVVKSPYGVAGKGLRLLPEGGGWGEADAAWARRVLREEGGVVVEPWHDRVLDFSVHYDRDLRLLGYVRLHNDARGHFLGCSLEKPLTAGAGEGVARFFYGPEAGVESFYRTRLPDLLRPHLERLGYRGPLSVDAMIARESDGRLALHPLVEINPRYTMGRLLLELGRHAVKGERAVLQILTRRHWKTLGGGGWPALARRLREAEPCQFYTYQNGKRRLRAGCLALNDPEQARSFLAILRVGHRGDPLL